MKIRCLNCNDIIESTSVHDLKECKCGACFIDGGDKYVRIAFTLNEDKIQEGVRRIGEFVKNLNK